MSDENIRDLTAITVVAVAGRRVDAPAATAPRFPLANVDAVRERLREKLAGLADNGATWIVASAACGADLLALQVAAEAGLRSRIVLPFDPARFRETSVVDRPGSWGELYDEVIADAAGRGDLVELSLEEGSDDAYIVATVAILDEAERLARESGGGVAAVTVWNGSARGDDDITLRFRVDALERGFTGIEVLTV